MAETKERIPLYADYQGQGPLAYKLRTTLGRQDTCLTVNWAPSYSLRPKHKHNLNDAPGPHYVVHPNMTNKGLSLKPSYSLQSRPPMKGIDVTPGPGEYNSNIKPGTISTEENSPNISMGLRTRSVFKGYAPPPNTYDKPTTLGPGSAAYKGAPAWAFKGRQDHGSIYYHTRKNNAPGSGAYATTDPNTYKRRSGVPTCAGRTQMKEYNSAKETPGPGAYDYVTPRSSGPTLGIRHSSYITPMITAQDIY